MKHESPMTPEQERQMLEHFRVRAQGEPSAAVDAHILAAARAATQQQATARQSSGLSARLYSWLFGGRGHQRWSLALAGVACLGIAVSLTWRQFEPGTVNYDAAPVSETFPTVARQAPMMPTPAHLNAPAEEVRAKVAQPKATLNAHPSQKRIAEAASIEQHAVLASAPAMEISTPEEQLLVVDAQVHERLQMLLTLRQEGKVKEAEAVMKTLREDYPDMDIEALLRQLRAHK